MKILEFPDQSIQNLKPRSNISNFTDALKSSWWKQDCFYNILNTKTDKLYRNYTKMFI